MPSAVYSTVRIAVHTSNYTDYISLRAPWKTVIFHVLFLRLQESHTRCDVLRFLPK